MVTPTTKTRFYASNRAHGTCSVVNTGSDMDNVTIDFSVRLICVVGSLAERIILAGFSAEYLKINFSCDHRDRVGHVSMSEPVTVEVKVRVAFSYVHQTLACLIIWSFGIGGGDWFKRISIIIGASNKDHVIFLGGIGFFSITMQNLEEVVSCSISVLAEQVLECLTLLRVGKHDVTGLMRQCINYINLEVTTLRCSHGAELLGSSGGGSGSGFLLGGLGEEAVVVSGRLFQLENFDLGGQFANHISQLVNLLHKEIDLVFFGSNDYWSSRR